MAVITFMSDFGEEDAYVAAVKGALLSENQTAQIIDTSHRIRPYDIGHAAWVLQQYRHRFPPATVHLVAVDAVYRQQRHAIAVELNGQFIVTFNSGLIGLIADSEPLEVVQLPESSHPTFAVLDAMVPGVAALAKGEPLKNLGDPIDLVQHTQPIVKLTKREIAGQIVHVDRFGNLISNIRRDHFEEIVKVLGGEPPFHVQFARERVARFHTNYFDVEDGDCFVLFNSDRWLEIGINKGRANDLLGLGNGDSIVIHFNP